MANSLNTQILNDGPRNTTLRVVGYLDTSDLASQVLIDPATLNYNPAQLRIDAINFDVKDGCQVNLSWDATTAVPIGDYTGRGCVEAKKYGGIQNNAGAGKTGKILIATQGWSTGAILTFVLTLEFVKQ